MLWIYETLMSEETQAIWCLLADLDAFIYVNYDTHACSNFDFVDH